MSGRAFPVQELKNEILGLGNLAMFLVKVRSQDWIFQRRRWKRVHTVVLVDLHSLAILLSTVFLGRDLSWAVLHQKSPSGT